MSLENKSPEEINALAELADSVMSNPKTRTPFQRILKAANPNISVPEIEIEDRIAGAVKPHVDRMAQLEAAREQDRAKESANVLYETLRDDRIVKNRTDFSELVQYAASKGFMTNDAGLRMAGQHRTAETTSAEPTNGSLGQIDVSDKEKFGDWMKDPAGTARRNAAAAIDDFRKKRQAA